MSPTELENRLKENFDNADVLVTDLTGGESNFEVRIASPEFKGKTRVQCHKSVMDVFDEELKSGEIHALTIRTIEK